jgi:uncharacterized protein YprB with RNaseH-like and TPR domain
VQLDPKDFIRLTKQAKSIVFWDIETNNLKADYGSVLVISAKPIGQKPVSFVVEQPGHDIKVVREARDYLNSFDLWSTYYGKGFDVPFVNTRLLRHKLAPLALIPHVDMFFQLKPKTLMGSKSMASYASFLKLDEQKMHIGPDTWSEVNVNKKHLKTLQARCESDCAVLEEVFLAAEHLIRDIKR